MNECVNLAQFTDIAASELYSEILDCKMLPTTVLSEILLKSSLELIITFIYSYGVNTAALQRLKFATVAVRSPGTSW